MGTNTTLDDILNNIINQYATLIVNASGIEERQALKQQRNRGIINTIAGLAAKENKHLSKEAKQAIEQCSKRYGTQDDACAAAYHDSVHSSMSAGAVLIAADNMVSCNTLLGADDTTIRTLLIMIANLAARLSEHTGSLSCHAE